MSDPSTARTDGARSGQDAHRPRRLRPRRWAALVALTRAVLIAVGLVTAYYLLPLDEGGKAAAALIVCGLVAVLLVFAWEVRVITRSPHPRLRAIEALAATLVLFLVLFASAYYLLDRSAADSFSEPLTRTDALYFTLTTFSTVGYGDITAHSQTGRVLTMLQMTGGLLLVGVAARVLASAVQAGLRRQSGEPSTESGSRTDAGTPDEEARS
ncbi:potassium channel family protein [Streptomyces sp. AC550_RSS872]|uniref:potassium channel family protein n=1 Tax=Streptomyces sp. AC550_RSS872 TaxID=2823689 RepID=UPI001C266475|nr:potassium channel family protein [Streptomyces sp. AC550_RSS872]